MCTLEYTYFKLKYYKPSHKKKRFGDLRGK